MSSAKDVLDYMLQRQEQLASLFQVRGVHRARFILQLNELKDLEGAELQKSLHCVCEKWDKSVPPDFAKFKGRVRRYLYSRRRTRAISISSVTKLALDKFVSDEGLLGADEAISQLLAYWKINTKN